MCSSTFVIVPSLALPFCRRRFKMHALKVIFVHVGHNLKIVPEGVLLKTSIAFILNKRQATTLSNDDIVHQCM